jgi:uncharacterized protein (TIGR03437 family)
MALAGASVCLAQSAVPLNTLPSRIVGHPNPEQNSNIVSGTPNLVAGRELFNPYAIALDTTVTPQIIYVADADNNRVLAWKNAAAFSNGQQADLVIGQGTSGSGAEFFSTLPKGPGISPFSTGLTAPLALAVDKNGDLYIADTGNNRILRFRKPFANAGNLFPDLYIGQPNLSSRNANFATGIPDARGLYFPASLAFDSSNNLWVVDQGNRRVLRFAAADVAAGGGPLAANAVIGQLSFTTLGTAVTKNNITAPNAFALPFALGFDPQGRLYVSDSDGTTLINRVLVFDPNCPSPKYNGFATANMSACRIMGLPTSTDIGTALKGLLYLPTGFFFIPNGSKMGVVDSGNSRIMIFDTYENWPDPSVSLSPSATGVVGQFTFSNLGPNGAVAGGNPNPAPDPTYLSAPLAAVFYNNELYIADSNNNRVVVRPLQDATATQPFGPATRVLGQDLFDQSAPNLIEGREFNFSPAGGTADAGIAIDSTGDTPHLYVADTFNNRVLGFKDYRGVGPGTKADLVIGQADFQHGLCNQNGDPNHPGATTLCGPTGLLVDPNGNLYVADTGNGRVMRFPAPFAHQGSEQADVVLGQHNFTTSIFDPSPFTMARPYGIAFAGGNGLLVSDLADNRVLFIPFTNGDFSSSDSGKAATRVYGQQDFTSVTTGTAMNQMSVPHGIATDSGGRPYVVDTGNNRVLIFDTVANTQNGANASVVITGLATPRGIYVSQATGESWITDTNNFVVKKYPKFDTLITNQTVTAQVQTGGPGLALTLDPYGSLVVADATNRVAFYYPGLQGVNGFSDLASQALSPGMFASICSPGSACDTTKISYFGANTANSSDLPNSLPLPTSLGDVTVLFNGTPAPLYYVSPNQINFYVSMNAPTSGTASLVVQQTSTGRIYAAGSVQMQSYSPSLVMSDYSGKLRQAVVVNQDNSINSPTNAAAACSIITLYGTGQGFIPNAPPDGSPAPASPVLTTSIQPRIYIGGFPVDSYPQSNPCDPPANQFVAFSGLTPGAVGLWQINVHVPGAVAAGIQVPVFVVMGSTTSIDTTFTTTIAVKAKQ